MRVADTLYIGSFESDELKKRFLLEREVLVDRKALKCREGKKCDDQCDEDVLLRK